MLNESLRASLSRRRVLGAAVAGMSIPALSALLAACGGDDDDDDPTATSGAGDATATTGSGAEPTEAAGGEATATTGGSDEPTATAGGSDPTATTADGEPTATTAAEVEPTSPAAGLPLGGSVNFVTSSAGQPAHLDTQLTAAGIARLGSDPINDWLVKHDQNNEHVPSLAVSIEVDDETAVIFNMRPGVMFHNGRALVADDVRQNIERVQNPDNASPFAASMAPVTSVEVPDDATAIFHLERPYPVLFDLLTRIPIIPLEAAETMKTNPVGAGPFMFSEWEQDSYIEYVRFDSYWDPEQPRLDSLRYNFVPDYSAGKASFQSGQQDMLLTPSLVDIQAFEGMASQGIRTQVWNSLGFGYLAMNHEREPYNIPQVRQAVQLAIDREAFNTVAYAGLSQPHYIPILDGTPFYVETFAYERDLDQARALLAEAGYPDGFEDEVLIPNTSFEAPYGPLIQNQLAEIGIDLSILLMEPGPFVERTLQQKDYNICMLGDSALPDPAFLIDRYLLSDGGSNLFNYRSEEMDELLTQAGSTYDLDERIDFYNQAMALMVDEAVWQIIVQRATSNLYRDPLITEAFWRPTARYEWGLLAKGS